MAVTHPSSMRNLIADTVVDTLDGGATNAVLYFIASNSTTICINTFNSTAFGAAAAGVATANSITDGNSSTAGTITAAIAYTSTLNESFRCSVTSTGGGGDIELSNNVMSSGQTLSITALTYTGPT